jgi:hypothetical protein
MFVVCGTNILDFCTPVLTILRLVASVCKLPAIPKSIVLVPRAIGTVINKVVTPDVIFA